MGTMIFIQTLSLPQANMPFSSAIRTLTSTLLGTLIYTEMALGRAKCQNLTTLQVKNPLFKELETQEVFHLIQ
jgi:hypothetical protein